jgi:hypothetical protein
MPDHKSVHRGQLVNGPVAHGDSETLKSLSPQKFYRAIDGVRILHESLDSMEKSDGYTVAIAKNWMASREEFRGWLQVDHPMFWRLDGISSAALASTLVLASYGQSDASQKCVCELAVNRIRRKNHADRLPQVVLNHLEVSWSEIVAYGCGHFQLFQPSFVQWFQWWQKRR